MRRRRKLRAAFEAPYEVTAQGIYSAPPMVPTPDEMAMNLGCLLAWSKGSVAWKRRIGPLTLMSTCSSRSEDFILETSRNAADLKMPALAMTMSRCDTPCFLMLSTASRASVAEALSIFTRISLLPWALLRLRSALDSSLSGLRTAATTTVSGLERYFCTKPRPRPCMRW